ncbi:MAG: pilin [Patescibacteria group bacterium]
MLFVNRKRLVISIFIFGILVLAPLLVFAEPPPNVLDAGRFLGETVDRTGVAKTDVVSATGEAVRILLTTVGIFFFVLVFYAGFRWMTARGEEEAATKARKTLIAAVIGLVLIVSAYGMSVIVSTGLLKGTEPSEEPAGSIGGGYDSGSVETGCCFDEVQRQRSNESWDFLDSPNKYWTWRITTQEDCRARGETPEPPEDVLVGPTHWDWRGDLNAEGCEAEFERRYAEDIF